MQEFMFYFPELDMYLYPMTIFRMGLTPSDFTNNEAAFMEELSMGKATPFTGWKVMGKCEATICDNKVVYHA